MSEHYLDFEKPLQDIDKSINELRKSTSNEKTIAMLENEISDLEKFREFIMETIYRNLTPWQTIQVARHPERPLFQDYMKGVFTDFVEIHGDRHFADDKSIITGWGKIGDEKFMVIGEEKGRTTKEKIYRNFGLPQPEGYRKALRAMRLAEKFKKPIITFVDVQGAYPGIGSEERSVGEAIARNLFEMSALTVPIVTVVIGEGGSGGALAIAVSDRVLMLENSYYSVITPEACATILWRDSTKSEKAAKVLKLTAKDLLGFKIIEEIIPEPKGGAHRDKEKIISIVKETILKHYAELKKLPQAKLVQKRYERFRALGKIETL